MSNKLMPDIMLMLKYWLACDVGIEQVKKLKVNIHTYATADRHAAQKKA